MVPIAAASLLALGWTSGLQAQPQLPVSVQGTTMAGGSQPVMLDRRSPNGDGIQNEVVFVSGAPLLVADANGVEDVYLRTSDSSPYHLISVNNAGVPGNGASQSPSSTPDGSVVVFSSAASNLVAGDGNGASDIFLRSTLTSQTRRVSVASDGTEANGPSSRPAISADGSVIAFVSSASNLVPNDTNGGADVFVRDLNLTLDGTSRVSLRSDGAQAEASGPDVRVSISASGRWVVFSSVANNLVAVDGNTASDIFLHDRNNGQTTRISVNTVDGAPNGDSFNPVISADGRFVAFDSLADNLVLSDSNGVSDVFVRRLGAQRTERISISSTGLQAIGASTAPSISADGRFVAFSSAATNLGEGADNNGHADIFLRDRISGTTRSRVQGNGASSEASVSPDGRALAYSTLATNLGVMDGNLANDVWRSLGRPEATLLIDAPQPPTPGAGQPVRIPVRVLDQTGLGPTPRGGVEILLTGGGQCTVRLLDNLGEGSCELTARIAGPQEISGRFLGDTDYAPTISSRPVTVSGNSATTLTTVIQAPQPSIPGEPIYVQADLQPPGGAPFGSIQFSSQLESCTATLPESGCLLRVPEKGATITASYYGDGNFGSALAPTVSHSTAVTDRIRVASGSGGDGRGSGGPPSVDPPSLSRDGRYFVFSTGQRWLVPDDDDRNDDVFLLDRRLGLIRRLSVPAGGGVANSDSVDAVVSGNGRYVAFTSYASNLLPGDTNGRGDVFVHDVYTGALERVSVANDGSEANDTSLRPALSDDGKLVVFHTRASNLVPGDSNGQSDVFLRNRVALTTERVSVANGGGQASGGVTGATNAQLSADGRYVVYQASFNSLVGGDSNSNDDIFRLDRLTGRVIRVSVSSSGLQLPAGGTSPDVSADGDRIVFQSNSALDDDPSDTNTVSDVFLHEVSAGTSRRVSTDGSGTLGNRVSRQGAISADGQTIAFATLADNLIPGGSTETQVLSRPVELDGGQLQLVSQNPNGLPGALQSDFPAMGESGDLIAFRTFSFDLDPQTPIGGYMLKEKGTIIGVQRGPIGLQPNASSFAPVLSQDGRRVAFLSEASNLGFSTGGFPQIFHRDLDSNMLTLVSAAEGIPGNGLIDSKPAISANGRLVAFSSTANNLIPLDANNAADVFVRDLDGGPIQRVSVANDGGESPVGGVLFGMSPDGRYVIFGAELPGLETGIRGPQPLPMQLYRRDRQTNTTVLMSPGTPSGYASSGVIWATGPSNDGCRVAFLSNANNLVNGVSDGRPHVYRYDQCTSTMILVDIRETIVSNGNAFDVAMDASGDRVAFVSTASNLGVSNTNSKLFLANLPAGTLTVESRDEAGVLLPNGVDPGIAISAEQGLLLYPSAQIAGGSERRPALRQREDYLASQTVQPSRGGGSGPQTLYVRDPIANNTAALATTEDSIGQPTFSAGLGFIGFVSDDDLLMPGDRNNEFDALIVPMPLPLGGGVLSLANLQIPEGDANNTVNADVTLSGATSFPVTVLVNSAAGTALADVDYTEIRSQLVVFNSNGTLQIPITIRGDTTPEADETFQLLLSGPSGASIGVGTATVTILNDDFAANVCTRQGAGEWGDSTRWSCTPTSGVVPGTADTAIFDSNDDRATLMTPVTVATLDLRAGLIDGGNGLTVTSQFLWSGGTLEAPDTFVPITLPAGSSATLTGGAKTLRRRQLVNQGTLTWTAGQLTLAGADTELRNEAAFITDVAAGTLRLASDGATGQFFHNTFNGGTSVTKRGAGRYEMDDLIEFRNGNSVLVEAGTASFTGPGSGDLGPYQVDNSGILEFNLRAGQTRSIAGPVTGGGSLLKLGQGDVLLQGSFGVEGASVQDGRLLFQQGGTVALTHLLVGGSGTLGGTANLQAQRLTWSGGTISGTAGTTLRLLGSGTNESALLGVGKCLDARQLILAGEARWTAGKLCLRTSARIEVASGGVLEVEPSSLESLENNDNTAVRLDVAGTLRKQGAVLDSDVPISAIGTLQINAGSLTQRANLSGSGNITIAAGARLQFAPTGTISAGLSLTGNGEVVTLSGTTQLQRPITGNTLSLLVQGSSIAQVEATLALRGLGVSGGALQLFQSLSTAGASSYSGGTIQVFAGNLDLAGPTAINVASADRLISCESGCTGSALRLRAGADVLISGTSSARLTGGLPLILDDPAARLAIGTGATLELSGADQLQRGTLVVDGVLSRATGTLSVGNGTALALSGNGTLRAASGITLNASIAPGNSNIGQLTLDGPTSITGGQLRMELASAASFDRIVMAGTRTLALNPAAELQPGGPYTPAASDVFPLIQHANGARTGSLALVGSAPGFLLQYAATAVEYRQLAGPRVCRLNVPSGLWDDPASWVCTPTDGFPGAIDTAIVDNGGSVDQNGARTVTGLQLVNGTISSTTHPLIVTGSFSWTGGRLTGTADTSDFVRIESTATSVTLGGVQKTLTERELRLDADAGWTTGLIELGNNGQLLVFPGRTLTTTPNATPPEFVFGSGTGAGVNNQGRILKTGAGKSGIESSVSYEGAGALEVAASGGEFFLHAPSSSLAGELRAATGGRLVFANSDQNFTSAARLVGAGEFQFGRDSAPRAVAGGPSLHRVPAAVFTQSPGASVVIFDATLRIDAPGSVAFERLTLAHPLGALSGDTALSVTQSLTWSAGSISTSLQGLTLAVASGATATLPGAGLRNLTRTLDVAGTMIVEGGTLMLDGFTEVQIQSGAVLRLTGNGTSTLSAGAGYSLYPLQNNGRIERQGSGTTLMSMGLQQNGIVAVDAGATLEFGDFASDPAARFEVNGTLRNASGLLAFGGGTVEGSGTLQATVVDNIGANFRPAGTGAGTLTVNGEYRQQTDGRLSLDLLGTGCTGADRLVATGSATLAGGLTLSVGGGCTPTPPQAFLLLDATTLTGTFTAVSGLPTPYAVEYLGTAGDVRLRVNQQASLTTITNIEPRPTPVGQPYTVSVTVVPAPPGSGPAPTGTVTVTADAPFASESCTITLPASSCTMPTATLPGRRTLVASYSGDALYLSSSANRTHPVQSTPIVTALGQIPASAVVGQPFTVRARVVNPLSTLTPTGEVQVRPLPLGEMVSCMLVETTPGTAEASCPGVISPIAAAKLIDIRYRGSENLVFGVASASSVQDVTRASTTLAFASAPNPSAPGAAVQVDFTLAAAAPSQSPLSAITGLLSVTDGVDSCTATLPATRCTLTLSTLGVRQLRARYQGDANFNPSLEVVREHLVAAGGAELIVRKRNLQRTLPGGAATVYVIEVENRGPLAVTALVRDPVPAGLSNFRWTCSSEGGAQCPATGTGALNENVLMPVGSLARFVLTADVQREPEVTVIQEARIDPPGGVDDPNPANNVVRDIDSIGLFGDGFEGDEPE